MAPVVPADFVALYGLHRSWLGGPGRRGPPRGGRAGALDAAAFAQVEAAADPGEAARRLVRRLDDEAARAASRFAVATGYAPRGVGHRGAARVLALYGQLGLLAGSLA
ncbi:MAG: hypothetical protein R3F60_10900 [bacterium]